MLVQLFWLVIGHFVADYTLQTDFIAQRKSKWNSIPAVPWYYVLTAHAATHAAAVGIITGSPLLAALELIWHWIIDHLKCMGLTSIHIDQFLHVVCKIILTILFHYGIK
jgi:hypothetical protein